MAQQENESELTMPSFGYDHENLGVLDPFVIQSILGGELNLLPSPEEVGIWLTWGFNPYDAGNEYSEVSKIPIEGTVMRVPMFHVNLSREDMTYDFVQYLQQGIQLVYERMHKLLSELGMNTAIDTTYTIKVNQVATQLNNMMRVAMFFNMMPIVQDGTLAPLQIRFGKRYIVKRIDNDPETVEQSASTNYVVIDVSDQQIESTWDTKAEAQTRCDDLNSENEEEWISGEVSRLAQTDQRLTDNVQHTVTTRLISMGKSWGDEITTSDIDAALA